MGTVISYVDPSLSFTLEVSANTYVSATESVVSAAIVYISAASQTLHNQINEDNASAGNPVQFNTHQSYLVFASPLLDSTTKAVMKWGEELGETAANDQIPPTLAIYNHRFNPTAITIANASAAHAAPSDLVSLVGLVSVSAGVSVSSLASRIAGNEVLITITDFSQFTSGGSFATFAAVVSSYGAGNEPAIGVSNEKIGSQDAIFNIWASITNNNTNVETSVLVPTSTLGSTLANGTVTDIDEGTTSPDSAYVSLQDNGQAGYSFTLPTEAKGLYGTQDFVIYSKATDLDLGRLPVIKVGLLFAQTCATSIGTVSVSSITGQTNTISWSPSEVAGAGDPAPFFTSVQQMSIAVCVSVSSFNQIATEYITTLAPVNILTQTNLTGAVTDIDEGVSSPDANWLTAATNDVGVRLEVDFSGNEPVGSSIGEVTQNSKFNFYIRKIAAGGGDPIIGSVYIMERGVTSTTLTFAPSAITSETGVTVSASWNHTLTSTYDTLASASIGIGILINADGGGPNRRSAEIGAVQWDLAYTSTAITTATHPEIGAIDWNIQYITTVSATAGGAGYANKVIGVANLSKVEGVTDPIKVLGV